MDDQQGNLIDGTARARQWRRSRANSRAASSGGEQHSEAPKSIAPSLLVPAEMLDSAIAPNVECDSVAASPDRIEATDRDEGLRHVNPFLVRHAAAGGKDVRPTRLRRVRSLGRRVSHRGRGSTNVRRAAPIALASAALAAVAAVGLGLAQSGPSTGRPARSQAAAGTGRSLEQPGARLLASSPFDAKRSFRSGPAPQRAHQSAHRSSSNRSMQRRATRRPTGHRITAAHHVAAGSGRTSSTSSDVIRISSRGTPSFSSPVSTATPTAPAVSQHATISSSGSGSSGRRPAFGANGMLAPGSSPDS
jgi:hypothetical protein